MTGRPGAVPNDTTAQPLRMVRPAGTGGPYSLRDPNRHTVAEEVASGEREPGPESATADRWDALDRREEQVLDCLLRHGLIDPGERRRAVASPEPRRIGDRGA